MESITMSLPSVSAIKRCTRWSITGIALATVGAVLLLVRPAAHAHNREQQVEKSEAVHAGNAETGKKIFTKAGCYECHGREGQGAAQASGPRIGPSRRFIRPFIKYVRQTTGQMAAYSK